MQWSLHIFQSCLLCLKEFFPPLYILFSSEGPVLLPEGLSHSPTSPSPQLEEMEPRLLEFEQDPPNWRELASPEGLSSLSKKETKRQEVINGMQDRWTQHTVRGLHRQPSVFYSTSCFPSTPRAVCNRARPRADAERPSGDLLQAAGERTAPDHH